MEVSDQLHALAPLPTGKEPVVNTGQDAGWAPELVWMLWSREKALAMLGIKPRLFSPQPINTVMF
jgi:hypothetical protein